MITRRQFLAGLAAGGAALALSGCGVPNGPAAPSARQRRIWAVSDCHIGLGGEANDGRDGAAWLALAVAEQRKSQPRPDYVLALGDLSHTSRAEELSRYTAIRDSADMGPWFEIAGNHDFSAFGNGAWDKVIGRPARYTLLDGNTAFIFASAEQGSAAGLLSDATLAWMAGEIDRRKDGNVIVCTHQPMFGTVDKSREPGRFMLHEQAVARLVEEHRVDLWLCGHIHSGPRTPGYVVTRGRTTFVNIASAGHAYGTGRTVSYSFTAADGSRTLTGRCRDHEARQFLADNDVRVELPHPWKLGDRPILLPADMPRTPATRPAPAFEHKAAE